MRYVVTGLLVLALAAGVTAAGELKKGDKEASLRASYSDTDFGSADGFDLGSTEQTEVAITYGWLVSDHHEFGFVAGYLREKSDGGDLFEDTSIDGTSLGGFYAFNFGSTGTVTPYVAAVVALLDGDLGETYDLEYGAEVGLKIYPFEHAGLSVSAGYSKLRSDVDGLDDADSMGLGVGLLIKY